MKNVSFIFSLLLFLLLSSNALFAQHKTNHFKNKERQGLWITYHDSAKTKINDIGKYRNGYQKGIWKYYNEKGNLLKKDRYIFRTSFTKLYFTNGKLSSKGKTKLIVSDTLVHYFYYGKWLVYDSLGELVKKQRYETGKLISENYYKTTSTKNFNDSLVIVLRSLDKQVYKYSDSVTTAEKNFGIKSEQYKHYLSLYKNNELKIQADVDKIIFNYGYPTKAMVGSDNTIPFSIISYSDISYKERYYNLIIDAADKGELEWGDVVFFVDKVKVAKKQPQIYGTQFKKSDHKQKYYPIEDKANLNERRKKRKLWEMNIDETDDTASY